MSDDALSLSHIRCSLIRQEDTIIFALIERSQFKRNDVCYQVCHHRKMFS
jgi:chorismate mutase|tara:strand:- start:2138 stop:2287 length:150 start_codon:yes stop_codon:yes gene_type:complete